MTNTPGHRTSFRDRASVRLDRVGVRRRLPIRPSGASHSGRPASRPADSRELHAVLTELARSRGELEDLRRTGGSLAARADLVSNLHRLRSEAARLRVGGE